MDTEEIIQITNEFNRGLDVPPWITNRARAWQARLWLTQGNMNAASKWAAECGESIDGELQYMREFEYLVLARVLIAQGRLNDANKLLQRLSEAAEAGGRTSSVIEILILQALTFQAQGDTEQAISSMKQAFNLAEPKGFIRIFVDEGPPIGQLLYKALGHGIAPEYVSRLLAAFPEETLKKTDPTKFQPQKTGIIEALTDRETEVLKLIAEGLTNQDIASRLYLSQNTVKVHTRNIFGKLSVNNRTQAVGKAKALGILI